MANDFPATSGQLYDRVLNTLSFYIAITAHNPLGRFDPLLKCLRGYSTLPGHKCVYIYIDHEHEQDVADLEKLVEANVSDLEVSYCVAPPEYIGYSLTWAHKPQLERLVKQNAFDYYIYAENDMLFSIEHFNYWRHTVDLLRPLNLEPGFCRFESFQGQRIPFDNYRRWSLTGPTRNVWGDRPFLASTYLRLDAPEVLGFVSLGNPYGGLMILDEEDARKYIVSESFDPVKSYEKTGHRNWPIADRSSMGLAFEGLLSGQEHRRVVPLISDEGTVRIPDFALLEHLDVKYSQQLAKNSISMITVDTMFDVK